MPVCSIHNVEFDEFAQCLLCITAKNNERSPVIIKLRKKKRCSNHNCNRILTKLYRRDSATTPYYPVRLECRDCDEAINTELLK